MAKGLTPTQFAIDLKRFGEVSAQQARLIFRKIIIDLDTAVVLSTPVDTGRARGNWFPSLTSPSNEVDDFAFGADLGLINAVASEADLGDIAWLTNNLPYILPLENGHSKQAPAGMVDVNLNAFAAKYGGSVTR